MEEYEESFRLEQIREIELEELQIEEVDEADISSSDDESMDPRNDEDAEEDGDITYNACLVSMDSYIDEVDDTHNSASFLDGGAIVNLPMFYVEVVLFPEATLPLRVTAPRFRASLEKALNQSHAPATLGVVYVHKDHDSRTLRFSAVGTTAEIQHHRLLRDGSVNILTRGKQRFYLRHRWTDSEGAPCAEIQIIQEDIPLRTPRDAFGQLASVTNFWNSTSSYRCSNQFNNSECSETSFENDLSLAELQLHKSAIKSCQRQHLNNDKSVSSYRSPNSSKPHPKLRRSKFKFDGQKKDVLGKNSDDGEGWMVWTAAQSKLSRMAPKSFWPHWVYRMYDSYSLAQRSAVMWTQIIGGPSMDEYVRKPDILSYHIASKLPVSEGVRHKLLEIDGVSYRLRREIEILESIDSVRCRICQAVIAKRSEMLATNRDSPFGAYANIHDYVSQIKVYSKVNGLGLFGSSSEEYSWFPGYAWTVATCKGCQSVMGWRFTAVEKRVGKLDSFWAIRSSHVAKTFAAP